MSKKLKITGKDYDQKIFLDGVPISPKRIDIKMLPGKSEAILHFEDIQIETDTEIDNIRELTKKNKSINVLLPKERQAQAG